MSLRPDVFATIFILLSLLASSSAQDVPPPAHCTPQINRQFEELLDSGVHQKDNVMVCGTTVNSSHPQRRGRNGSHQILPVLLTFPDNRTKLIQVVTNDELDGVVTAPARATVFAYGQAFFDANKAGVHDVHCSTHRGADNGWVVVNGVKYPGSCDASNTRRHRR
jgi:hypothetical protein